MDYPGKVITKTQVTPTQTSASGNWTLDDQAAAIKNNNWPVALVPNPISKSLRFNSADSAYLNRTPASAGNRRTWTWSGWVKRSALSSTNWLMTQAAGSGLVNDGFFLSSGMSFYWNFQGAGGSVDTSAVFRDASAWYHIVVKFDTTQATSTNRIIFYVNGVQQTQTGSYPAQNYDGYINSAAATDIGRLTGGTYFSGYLTEINFIDGQALTPSDFGLTNPQTGQWIPKKYTGTYGTNGFYLNFKDATSTTTLGYDYSGNANNWTTNNFSVTAGSGNDSLTDVPTPWVAYSTTGDSGGVVRGNYCTLNPLNKPTNIVLANGNLQATNSVGAIENVRSTMPTASTYSYWEVTASVVGSSLRMDLGGILSSYVQSISNTSYLAGGASTGTFGANWDSAFRFYINGSNVYSSGTANLVANDVVMFAHDSSTGKIWVGLNGTWYNSGNPAAGTGNLGTLNAETVFPAVMINGNVGANGVYTNFGQRPFAYTPPAGFRSLCTTNLPATTIGFGLTNQGDDYFNTVLYTGNGSTNNITGVGFQPDFVWLKDRTTAFNNYLYDAVRGTTKALQSNSTNAEETRTGLTAFGSDGFTLGSQGGDNQSSDSFVAWNWKAGGTGVTNTAGSITSTVSANTTAGFSVVTYTGTGVAATVGHGLGVAPSMIIVKDRDDAGTNWCVYHVSLGNGNRVLLNLTNASAATGNWNSTSPTSSVFSIGVSSEVSANNKQHVAYCFAAVAGYSAFGSYTGNGSADGPFVYTGFRPRYLMVKEASGTSAASGNWVIYDAARDTYNVCGLRLVADNSYAEGTVNAFDFLSNGFKLRTTDAGRNESGGTYIYMAFAESPFQFANAR